MTVTAEFEAHCSIWSKTNTGFMPRTCLTFMFTPSLADQITLGGELIYHAITQFFPYNSRFQPLKYIQ